MRMPLHVHIASDHRSVDLKQRIVEHLNAYTIQCDVTDYGTGDTSRAMQYATHVHTVCTALCAHGTEGHRANTLSTTNDRHIGILISNTSANGMAMTANTHRGIRAGVCWNVPVALIVRQQNDANVLCIPSSFVADARTVYQIVDAFVRTPFEGGPHTEQVNRMEHPCAD